MVLEVRISFVCYARPLTRGHFLKNLIKGLCVIYDKTGYVENIIKQNDVIDILHTGVIITFKHILH